MRRYGRRTGYLITSPAFLSPLPPRVYRRNLWRAAFGCDPGYASCAIICAVMEYERVPFDVRGYEARTQRRPCFICAIVAGTHNVPEHLVYRDDFAIAVMNQFPPLVGYVLVAPIGHRERWELDFTEPEHLRMQTLIRRIGRAVATVLPTERTYLLSLGSRQGNAHVHWHIAPLPPGVPYERQQGEALSLRHGYLRIPDADSAQLAARIASALENTD